MHLPTLRVSRLEKTLAVREHAVATAEAAAVSTRNAPLEHKRHHAQPRSPQTPRELQPVPAAFAADATLGSTTPGPLPGSWPVNAAPQLPSFKTAAHWQRISKLQRAIVPAMRYT